ncbi:MAG TPA: MASE1 domain-containing protein, partial [Candidatus Angelobacter sp.]|nr:MASE1 domain-containing protein [Candidatus Angelobacter sp.]
KKGQRGKPTLDTGEPKRSPAIPWKFYLGALPLFVLLYFGAGKLGLALAFINPSASAVWPPTGLALAAVLLWGNRLWPGIFIGSFLLEYASQRAVGISLCTGTGDVLEALTAATLVRRFAGGCQAFEQTRTTLTFLLLGPVVCTTISATVSVTGLCLGGYAEWSNYGSIWLTWWLGNTVSDLILTPFILLSLRPGQRTWPSPKIREAFCLLLLMLVLGLAVFNKNSFLPAATEWKFLFVLPLLWSAFRFGPQGAATFSLLLSVLALVDAYANRSLLTQGDPNLKLVTLQCFVGMLCITALVLAVAIAERKFLEQEILKIGAEERQRIGHELHDGLGQLLTGIAFQAKALENNLAAQKSPQRIPAAEIVQLLNQATGQTRNLAQLLSPVELTNHGLTDSLKRLAANTSHFFQVECSFSAAGEVGPMDELTDLMLFRIAQESTHNAVKHGQPRRIEIRLAMEREQICLRIRDNGRGFDPCSSTASGMGLNIMKHRAGTIGGRLEISSQTGAGTEVTCIAPLHVPSNATRSADPAF